MVHCLFFCFFLGLLIRKITNTLKRSKIVIGAINTQQIKFKALRNLVGIYGKSRALTQLIKITGHIWRFAVHRIETP